MRCCNNLKTHFKIVFRYSDLPYNGIIFYVSTAILATMLLRLHTPYQLNFPLIGVTVSVFFSGSLFCSLFFEDYSEILGYFHALWTIDEVLLWRILSLLIISVLIPVPVILGGSLFFAYTREFLDKSFFLFLTAVPVIVALGSLASVRKKVLHKKSSNILISSVVFVISVFPYLILYSLLGSRLLCVAFCISSLLFWFFYERKIVGRIFAVNVIA